MVVWRDILASRVNGCGISHAAAENNTAAPPTLRADTVGSQDESRCGAIQ
jgi:hypothetical protein